MTRIGRKSPEITIPEEITVPENVSETIDEPAPEKPANTEKAKGKKT